jgi:hypothetical protein
MSERRVRGSYDRCTDLDAVFFPARGAETCIYDLKVEGISNPTSNTASVEATESLICTSGTHSDRVVVVCGVCVCLEKNVHPENSQSII